MLPVFSSLLPRRRLCFSPVFVSLLVSSMGSTASHATMTASGAVGVSNKDKIVKSESEWRTQLTPQQYHVTREKGTERAWTSPYNDLPKSAAGAFTCMCCGEELFTTNTKFDSGSGWPSFYAPAAHDALEVHRDTSHGMVREEVTCAKCGAHLGHVFNDGPRDKTGLRYCINGVSLDFKQSK